MEGIGVLDTLLEVCRSRSLSRAACSSGDGTFSLMLSFRTPAVRLSKSSCGVSGVPLDNERDSTGVITASSPADKLVYTDGTRGTGGAVLGLEARLGVADRELPGLRVLAADAERTVLSPGALFSGVDVIVEAALFLRVVLRVLGDLSKDGSGRSLARSMVVLRLLLMACRFEVSLFGVSGNGVPLPAK